MPLSRLIVVVATGNPTPKSVDPRKGAMTHHISYTCPRVLVLVPVPVLSALVALVPAGVPLEFPSVRLGISRY